MQTFLPYADFRESAACLDYRRLGKQRVECLQILNALLGVSPGWVNHPATKMWRGYEAGLREYAITICEEWRRRGYKDACLDKIVALACSGELRPPWLGRQDFHDAHKSNLLRKDLLFYSRYGWSVPSNLPYLWS